jgi:hypothetical protein
MKFNKWTLALASAGVVSLGAIAQAEEKPMSQVLTAVSQTTLSGYVDTSAMWYIGPANPQSSVQLPGRAFDGVNKINGFNLDVIELTLEKPLSEDQWASGYMVQLLYGPDAVGYNPSVSSSGTVTGATSDFAIKQAYVALRVPIGNGLDLKLGVFNTIIGYESFESYLNPNFSRSYGWQLEPTQNTGLLASYKISDSFSVSAGVANTWAAGTNTKNQSPVSAGEIAFMASATLTAPESWGSLKGSALYAGIVYGNTGSNTKQTTSTYIGATVATPVEGLAVGGAFDYRNNGPVNSFVAGNDNYAWSAAGYVTFQASEKWKLAGRFDFTEASAGTWFTAVPTAPNYGGTPFDTQKLDSLTLTADYALWANVVTRAEFRWDHSCTGQTPFGESGGNPAGSKDAYTLAANVVYKF